MNETADLIAAIESELLRGASELESLAALLEQHGDFDLSGSSEVHELLERITALGDLSARAVTPALPLFAIPV